MADSHTLVGDQPGARGENAPNFDMRVGFAPAQGGELKNVRRCLKPQKSDWAMLVAVWIAAGTAMWSVFKNACAVTCTPTGTPTTVGTYPWWVFIPVLLAFGSAVVSTVRFFNARKPDDHLQQAQDDVDSLIAFQAEAQEKVNREMVRRIAEDVGPQNVVDADIKPPALQNKALGKSGE